MQLRKELSGAGHGGRRRGLDDSQRVCISCPPKGKRHLLQREWSLVAKSQTPEADGARGSAPQPCCSRHCHNPYQEPLHNIPFQSIVPTMENPSTPRERVEASHKVGIIRMPDCWHVLETLAYAAGKGKPTNQPKANRAKNNKKPVGGGACL